jgi:hypothetical protein
VRRCETLAFLQRRGETFSITRKIKQIVNYFGLDSASGLIKRSHFVLQSLAVEPRIILDTVNVLLVMCEPTGFVPFLLGSIADLGVLQLASVQWTELSLMVPWT